MVGEDTSVNDEPFYTVAEIAALWKISKDSVRRMFANESGILVLHPSQPKNTKRQAKVIIRIPKSVFDRVRNRNTRLVA